MSSLADELDLDIWALGRSPDAPTIDVGIRNTPEALRNLRSRLPDCSTLIRDVKTLIAEEQIAMAAVTDISAGRFFDTYHPYSGIVSFLSELHNAYPRLVPVFNTSIGVSIEGRSLVAMHITSINSTRNEKPVVVLTAGIHAREWIAPSSCLYIVAELLTRYGSDPTATSILDSVEFVGAYPTKLVASEPETQTVQNYLLRVKSAGRNVIAGIDLHSYGQDILRSWGWTTADSSNEKILAALGDRMSQASLAVPRGPGEGKSVKYASFKACNLYVTSGSTDDWYTSHLGATGWTVELRDKGARGFVLPPSFIVPVGIEAYAMIVALVEGILDIPGGIPPNK
ncbi:hypothetical protein HDU93_007043 [Gonapodya sp. JEL0774]|nr:hypothetical protein HDU93_007043 [Gonapodya sp. JEL0774]